MGHIGRKLATNVTLVPGDLSLCQVAVAKAFDPLHCFNRYSEIIMATERKAKKIMNVRYVQPTKENICLDPSTIPPPTNQTYFAFSTYW